MNTFTWFVIVWVISIGITYWMLYYTASNFVVTFAKNGLLVNPNKMPHSNGKFFTLLSFIPIINIFFGFYLGYRYATSMQAISATSSVISDPMTDFEKEKFAKKPTFFTVCSIFAEREKLEELIKERTDRLNKMQSDLNNLLEIAKQQNLLEADKIKDANTTVQTLIDTERDLLDELKDSKITVENYLERSKLK